MIKHDDKGQAFYDALDAEVKAMRENRLRVKDYKPKKYITLSVLAENTHQTHDKAFIACHYCGNLIAKSRITRDHKIPKSKGGSGGKENIVPACRSCNTEKGSMMYIEYILWRRSHRKLITVWCQHSLNEYAP